MLEGGTDTRAPVRASLLRKVTWMGGDRRLVGVAGMIMVCLGWTMLRGVGMLYGLTLILPLGLFAVVVWVAREAQKADSDMIDIMMRHVKYRKYYAPKPDLGMEHPDVRDFN
jgi:type IV secretory pathway TrbD component